MNTRKCINQVITFYRQNGRALPWRQLEKGAGLGAYKILISEFMLQQTQVSRVIPKYHQFLASFPTLQKLAEAPLAEVLRAWSGLGYNRRALYLHQAARELITTAQPWTVETLVAQKGIGPNTAAAICVYAYDEPHIFIETNVRAVLIHCFFQKQQTVSDTEIKPKMEELLQEIQKQAISPREFYWGLMDYGVYLKKTEHNPSRMSAHYKKQPAFNGSQRQIRGQVIKRLAKGPALLRELNDEIPDERLQSVLDTLEHERLITKQKKMFHLSRS